MDWRVEDYYFDNHSEFDAQVDEFKESLKKAVKQEHIDEMNRIKKENEELQEVKKNFEAIKEDYARKERELEYERRDLLSKVRQDRLTELLKDREVLMYRVTKTLKRAPKCDKCDDKRQIEFQSPSGRIMYENCSCDKGSWLYVPEKLVRTSFSIDRYKMSIFYKPYTWSDIDGMEIDNEYSSVGSQNVYKQGDNFADLKKYDVLFNNEKDCLEYCEYLNNADSKEKKVEYEMGEIDL